jgi:flagellar hook protein FlgE
MMQVFSTALSGLNAASTAVDVVGNDLANLNTSGYKAHEIHFSDLVSEAMGVASAGSNVGLGVESPTTTTQFVQGSIEQTGGAMDCAIQGSGFFVLRGSNNQTLYTRDGSFTVDSTGHLQTASGQYVQGWNATNGVVDTNTPPVDVVIPANGVVAAAATANMSLTVNLNAAATNGATSGTYSTPIQVYDSQGGQHTLTATFTKGKGTNQWDYAVTIPSADVTGNTTLATGTLQFDGSGNLTSPASTDTPVQIQLTGLTDGAGDSTINWDMFSGSTGLITQYSQSSAVSASTQDGMASGQIAEVGISTGGTIVATYTNGQQATVGQIALASITNPESMVAVSGNAYEAAADTSAPAIGTAGTGGRGTIQGGVLEASTVDIATEFTRLITYQSTYQANSRVITTANQMVQDIFSVIR